MIGNYYELIKNSKSKVIVIGDVMLDRNYYGNIKRMSQEVPIPIIDIYSTKDSLGGAANVALNLNGLDCNVSIAGMIGEDSEGSILKKMLIDKGINYTGLLTLDHIKTTTKNRIYCDSRQMQRFDIEELNVEICSDNFNLFKDWFNQEIKHKPCAVIISDYGKGFCSEDLCRFVIQTCRSKGIVVLVDPKGERWDKYENADIITPNLLELSQVHGQEIVNEDKEIIRVAKSIREKFMVRSIFVTRSEKGVTVIEENKVVHNRNVSKIKENVTGAGDTSIAILAAFLKHLNTEQLAYVMNIGAGITIQKLETYPLQKHELLEVLDRSEISALKIYNITEILEKVKMWKGDNKKVVFTNGCFDILHIGHITYLEKAKKMGDYLIVALNSDESIQRLKGENRPINNENNRMKLIASLSFVDAVILFRDDTPIDLITKIRPNLLVKGGDYHEQSIIGKDYADSIRTLPYIEGQSTTIVLNKLEGVEM